MVRGKFGSLGAKFLNIKSTGLNHGFRSLPLTVPPTSNMLSKLAFGSAAYVLSTSSIVSALPYATTNSPEPTLKWAPCDLDFPKSTADKIAGPIDCATLDVPLDYTDVASEKTLTLQLIKQPATKEPFKGTIIFNPGGPGVSGVQEIAEKGHVYRDQVFNGQYNIVGFDTRYEPPSCLVSDDTLTATQWNWTYDPFPL